MDVEHLPSSPQKIRAVDRLRKLMASRDPRRVAAVKAANDGLLNMKLLTPGAVHVDAALSNMSVQYKNEEYIGENFMPVIRVEKLSNVYFIYGQRDRVGAPDDAIGPRSLPNEVNETRTTDNYSCKPKALSDFIDDQTLQNEDAPLNEMVDLVAAVNDAMDFRQELRIATAVQLSTNYASTNYNALGAANRWDSSGGGDPVGNIMDAIDALWQGMGGTILKGWCGADVWRILARHPRLLDVSKYTRQGFIKPKQFAEFFGLDEFHVGKARKDTANSGQTASYSRIWGNNFGVMRVAQNPGIRSVSWGYTFRFKEKITTQWYAPAPGVSGGYHAKVGQSVDHKVVSNVAGSLIATAIG